MLFLTSFTHYFAFKKSHVEAKDRSGELLRAQPKLSILYFKKFTLMTFFCFVVANSVSFT